MAIKVLRSELAGTSDAAQRFRSEIKLARKVSHRNVCRIHEYGEDGGIRYISMEYVEGTDIKQILRDGGPLRSTRPSTSASRSRTACRRSTTWASSTAT